MPGLIAVLGDRAPEATARRAAGPLLRRPWQAFEMLPSDTDRLAIGFAGERGGVARDPATGLLVALDGEIVLDDRIVTGPEAAGRLAARYAAPEPPREPPDGHFAACVWDPRARALRLVTDRLGHRPIYVTRRGGVHLVAGELKALLAAGVEPRLDRVAVAELLAYENMLGERTLLEGVRLVPPGSTLTLRPDGRETVEEWWRYRLDADESLPEEQLVDEFGRLLAQSVRRRLDPGTGLALSGGLDSRAIATVVRDASPDTLAVTYGAPGSEDLVLGTRVAAHAGLRHQPLRLEPGYIARGAARTVWLTEGQIRSFHVHHLRLQDLRADGLLTSLLIGFLGDPLVRGSDRPVPDGSESAFADHVHDYTTVVPAEVMEQLLAPDFAASLRGLAHTSTASHLAGEEGTRMNRRRQFLWRQTNRRRTLPGAFLFADDLAARDPFADRELIDFCVRMPDQARSHGRMETAYLRRSPELTRIRSPKSGIAPRLTGRREQLALRLVSERRRLESYVEGHVGPKRWSRRQGLGDYATDLRLAGADLLAIMLEPRTLARGQVREEAVRRLVDETLRGRARHTQALGLLLTLELIQRQFVDGEPAAETALTGTAEGPIRLDAVRSSR